MNINKARKVLGKEAIAMSDEQIKKELEIASFLAELVLQRYKQEGVLASNGVH